MASSWRSRLTAGLAVLALLVVMQLAFEAGQASVGGGDDDADAGSSDAAGPGDPGREAQNSAFSRSAEQPSGPDDDGTTRPLPWQPVDGLQQPQSRGDGGDVSRRGDAATDFQGSVSAESLPGNESGPRDSGSRDESRSSSASSDGSDVSAAPDDGSKESSSEASHSGVASASGSVGGSDDSGDGSENLASGSAATDASGSSSSSSHMQDDSGSVGSSETRSSQEGSASSDHEDASSSGLRSDASRAAPADSAGDECRADIREREGRCCSEIPSGYTWLNDTFPKKPPTEPWQALDMVKSPDGEVLGKSSWQLRCQCSILNTAPPLQRPDFVTSTSLVCCGTSVSRLDRLRNRVSTVGRTGMRRSSLRRAPWFPRMGPTQQSHLEPIR